MNFVRSLRDRREAGVTIPARYLFSPRGPPLLFAMRDPGVGFNEDKCAFLPLDGENSTQAMARNADCRGFAQIRYAMRFLFPPQQEIGNFLVRHVHK